MEEEERRVRGSTLFLARLGCFCPLFHLSFLLSTVPSLILSSLPDLMSTIQPMKTKQSLNHNSHALKEVSFVLCLCFCAATEEDVLAESISCGFKIGGGT